MASSLVARVLENSVQRPSLEFSLQKQVHKTMWVLLAQGSHSTVSVWCVLVCV